jgi:hypothetical protein
VACDQAMAGARSHGLVGRVEPGVAGMRVGHQCACVVSQVAGEPPLHRLAILARKAVEECALSAHHFGRCRLFSASCLRLCSALDGAQQ